MIAVRSAQAGDALSCTACTDDTVQTTPTAGLWHLAVAALIAAEHVIQLVLSASREDSTLATRLTNQTAPK